MKETPTPLLLIALLADGNIHSGEQLGESLGMSRAGINKHIQTLRSWGIDVQTVVGKGYQLDAPMNLLNADIVNQNIKGNPANVIPVIDSTNQYLMQRISELTSGDVCIAEYQSAGRGRRGRKWISPFGRNLYLSMYWKLEQGPAAAIGLSLVVGVIMAEVLQKLGAEGVKVKWPNDLYLNDKKLSGILVELTGKTGDVAHIITGIGINIAMSKNQNEAINQQWINLEQVGIKIDRNELACEITNALRDAFVQFEKQGLSVFIERWKSLDNFMDRRVKLIIGEKEIFGVAKGINDQGALLLEQNGSITPYIGGEISLRSAP
ncbi:bifunctional biotin--[acetyl-CoA-carboxylase] ligase/biotin operon repressor BirA [Proteus vulgaris]|jgi:BirA family biotin operon repressor/biotin-[acetyl-CoA-carboxylase] ligase|uniref:Bifunctional ligase/repressor BirA n=1 Tax=Proteus vulgaris TaxID=585 RepID=A0A379F927_PROVU|nr:MULTISPECIES: bifunctional biotin--[acetyl-CoA-carboxylase] ligase/biotin operon repressor BirA [Proteus]EBW1656487.1 bifunctional biotin--[acetyl-CoA-carboxylase] ligase/biotin operon repressor BirA [Salmonella enterica subsp. enterica serovar Typhimurium]NBN59234.1 bifunctional biotin--[acetyl-CoA-carboxylase] ligase/biotin operon repressor BirA [Proteus sp. G2639]AYY82603.1 bifunctional biotin--[acetyl-CoA-carboxylase] ligase/biotin operon repressor BirA [Proteus vulgaris]MBG5972900.1 bif